MVNKRKVTYQVDGGSSIKKYSAEFVVVHEDFFPLIGARAAQQMTLITVNIEAMTTVPHHAHATARVNQVLTSEAIVEQFPEVF